MADLGYTNKQAAAIAGVTQRQLVYWRTTALVVPTRHTTGGHARYGFTDLIALRTTKQLLDAGIPLQRIRRSIVALRRFLPSLKQPLSDISIIATGDVILAWENGTPFEAISGQEWMVPLAELQRRAELYGGAAQIPRQEDFFNNETENAINQNKWTRKIGPEWREALVASNK